MRASERACVRAGVVCVVWCGGVYVQTFEILSYHEITSRLYLHMNATSTAEPREVRLTRRKLRTTVSDRYNEFVHEIVHSGNVLTTISTPPATTESVTQHDHHTNFYFKSHAYTWHISQYLQLIYQNERMYTNRVLDYAVVLIWNKRGNIIIAMI